MSVDRSLHIADYIIFGGMLVITMGIGIYHAISSMKKSSTAEYLMGSRNLRTLPVSMSLMASFVSTVLVLGVPAETYMNGIGFWLQAFGISLGAIVSAIIMVPVFHPLRLTSINQYLKLRYRSTFVALLGTCSSLSFMLIYTGIVSFAPATAIESVTGFPIWASILVGCGTTIVYTTIGGFKAVIWTDVFQLVIMIIGLLSISIKAVMSVGNISLVWQECSKWERLNIFKMTPDPTVEYTFWSQTIGLSFTFIYTYGASQSAFQRFSSLPTLGAARLCVLLVLPGIFLMVTLATLSGISMFAFYASIRCDPLKAGYIKNSNQLVPHFVMDELRVPGIPGILFAGIASASLSTASSNLNAAAANMWDDVLRKVWPNLPETRNVLITKLIVVVFGLIAMGLAFAVSVLGGTVVRSMLSFAAAIGAPTTAMFLMGIMLPFVNGKGAAVGGGTGFVLALWVAFGSFSIHKGDVRLPSPISNCSEYLAEYRPELLTTTYSPVGNATWEYTTPVWTSTTSVPVSNDMNPILYKIYSLSYLWYGAYSMLIAFIVGIVVSLLTGGTKDNRPEARLLHPWVRRFVENEKMGDTPQYPESGEVKERLHDREVAMVTGDDIVVTRM